MGANIVIIPEPARAHLVIQGEEYEVELLFNFYDNMELSETNTDQEEICIRFVMNLVSRHIVGDKRIEAESIPEESCVEYIYLFLLSDSETNRLYKSLDETLHPCKRFLLTQKYLMHQMLEELKPTLSTISKSIQGIADSLTKSIKPIVESIQLYVKQYNDLFREIIKCITDQAKNLIDISSYIIIPQISEKDKQKIINRYIVWGDYGWTGTAFLSEELMNYQPVDISDANRAAKKLFNKQGVAKLFEQMEMLDSIKKTDLAELRSCYFSRNYKACVLISFAMIDAKLIHSQGKKNNRRPGNTGIKRLETKINTDKKGAFLLTLSATNLLQCLKKMFEESANFKKQPVVINRHFIAHGMLHRKVIQRDAIQTALLVYNLYYLTDLIEIMSKDERV